MRPRGRAIQLPGQPSLSTIRLCIEVDAVRYPDEHIAIGDAVVLGHTHTDAVASGVDHGLEVTGRIDPVIDGTLSGVSCASEHSQVIAETVGIAGVDSSLALLRRVMPGVSPAGANLGGRSSGTH